MIVIKSKREIEAMREAGQLLAKVHEEVAKHIRVGVTTKELDEVAQDYIISHGASPSFKGYNGFPGSICASVNEEVIHGIPSSRKLREGDIVGVDIGLKRNGYHADAARTYAVGGVAPRTQKLLEVTRQSFFEGLKYCYKGRRLSDISSAIQRYAEAEGFSIVRQYTGHGIGTELHEDPPVPNYGMPGRGPRLVAGMALAIEPMINAGTFRVKVLSDDWTVVTTDGENSAHYENTVIITDGEPEVLTLTNDEKSMMHWEESGTDHA